jgi:hypothetical protein
MVLGVVGRWNDQHDRLKLGIGRAQKQTKRQALNNIAVRGIKQADGEKSMPLENRFGV